MDEESRIFTDSPILCNFRKIRTSLDRHVLGGCDADKQRPRRDEDKTD